MRPYLFKMLPSFDENGFLPEGVWDCSIEEFRSRFAIFRRSDCRLKLFDKLEDFLAEILKTDWVREVIIDGSFVTDKAEPGDIDVLLALHPEFEETELLFWEKRSLDPKHLGKKYKFDQDFLIKNSFNIA